MKCAIISVFLLGVTVNGLVTPQQASLTKTKSYQHKHGNQQLYADASSAAADLNDIPRGGAADVGGGTATIPNEVFNLVKSIVGAGVLSLPAGTYFLEYNTEFFWNGYLSLRNQNVSFLDMKTVFFHRRFLFSQPNHTIH